MKRAAKAKEEAGEKRQRTLNGEKTKLPDRDVVELACRVHLKATKDQSDALQKAPLQTALCTYLGLQISSTSPLLTEVMQTVFAGKTGAPGTWGGTFTGAVPEEGVAQQVVAFRTSNSKPVAYLGVAFVTSPRQMAKYKQLEAERKLRDLPDMARLEELYCGNVDDAATSSPQHPKLNAAKGAGKGGKAPRVPYVNYGVYEEQGGTFYRFLIGTLCGTVEEVSNLRNRTLTVTVKHTVPPDSYPPIGTHELTLMIPFTGAVGDNPAADIAPDLRTPVRLTTYSNSAYAVVDVPLITKKPELACVREAAAPADPLMGSKLQIAPSPPASQEQATTPATPLDVDMTDE